MTLTADAPDPIDGDEFLFTWAVTGGRLKGEGQKVTWDLSGLPEGRYTATAELNDGHQHTSNASTTVSVAPCSECVIQESPCPTISVSCPAAVDSKHPIDFGATVAGGYYEEKLTYTWSVKGGKIVSGQGTSKITVDASNAGQPVTATVTVGGLIEGCTTNFASCRVDEVRWQQD